jgi:hypothetical protein
MYVIRLLTVVFSVVLSRAAEEPRLGEPPTAPGTPLKSSSRLEAAPAALGPTDWYDTSNRAVVQAAYNTVYAPTTTVSMGWTGSQFTGVAGTTTQAFKDAVTARVNWFRAMAGVPPGDHDELHLQREGATGCADAERERTVEP